MSSNDKETTVEKPDLICYEDFEEIERESSPEIFGGVFPELDADNFPFLFQNGTTEEGFDLNSYMFEENDTFDFILEQLESSTSNFTFLEPVEKLIREFTIKNDTFSEHIISFKQRSMLIKNEVMKVQDVRERLNYLNLYRDFLFDHDYTILKKDIDDMIKFEEVINDLLLDP